MLKKITECRKGSSLSKELLKSSKDCGRNQILSLERVRHWHQIPALTDLRAPAGLGTVQWEDQTVFAIRHENLLLSVWRTSLATTEVLGHFQIMGWDNEYDSFEQGCLKLAEGWAWWTLVNPTLHPLTACGFLDKRHQMSITAAQCRHPTMFCCTQEVGQFSELVHSYSYFQVLSYQIDHEEGLTECTDNWLWNTSPMQKENQAN